MKLCIVKTESKSILQTENKQKLKINNVKFQSTYFLTVIPLKVSHQQFDDNTPADKCYLFLMEARLT
jgi:hypothetical protein